MSSTPRDVFIASLHNWDRFSRDQRRRLDALANQGVELTQLARQLSIEFPDDTVFIELSRTCADNGLEVRQEIGAGGMAIVLRVYNSRTEREEALKLVRPGLDDARMKERFAREIVCLRKLSRLIRLPKAAIVSHQKMASDEGEALLQTNESADDSSPSSLATTLVDSANVPFPVLYEIGRNAGYFTMELLRGETLRDNIMRQGPMTLNLALTVTMRVAEALADLHSMRLVHRDVKPSNIFITDKNRVVLLDFGLHGRPLTAPVKDCSLTNDQQLSMIGTLAYTSPQQLTDPRKAKACDDIYSLGCVLYFLLTGRHAFGAVDSMGAALLAHRVPASRPEPVESFLEEKLSGRRPELPAELCESDKNGKPVKTPQRVIDLFSQMTDPDPARRIATASEVVHRMSLALGANDFISAERAARRLDDAGAKQLSDYLRHLRDQQVSFSKIPLVNAALYHALDTKEVFVDIALQKSERKTGGDHESNQNSQDLRRDGDVYPLGALLAQHRKLVFLGPPGGGKTTLLKRAALSFAEGLSDEIPGWKEHFEPKGNERELDFEPSLPPQLIPIFFRLRNFAAYLIEQKGNHDPASPVLLDYLRHFYEREENLELSETFFADLLGTGGCVVLMDGLDEAPVTLREQVAHHVTHFISKYGSKRTGDLRLRASNRPTWKRKAITEESNPQSEGEDEPDRDNLFLLSSRPRGYEQVASILGQDYTVCEVKALSLSSIQLLLENVLKAIEPNQAVRRKDLKNLYTAISESRELTILAGNPMFCTSLALVYKSKGAELPKRRIDVFNEIVGLLLGHWKSEDRQLITEDLSEEEHDFVERDVDVKVKVRKDRLSHIARWMQVGPKYTSRTGNGRSRTEIRSEEVLKVLKHFLIKKEGKSPADAADAAKLFLKFAHERSGLFVEIEPGVFAFTHEGFREYFVADAISNLLESQLGRLFTEHLDDSDWEQILLLAGAHPSIGDRFREKLLSQCVKVAERCRATDPKRWAHRLAMTGKMAFDMGDHLAQSVRIKLLGHLRKAVMGSEQGLAERLELALTLDGMDSVTNRLYDLVPLSRTEGRSQYIGMNLVSNRQYQRFLEADDYQTFWDPDADCDSPPDDANRLFRNESLRWVERHREGDRFPRFWSDSTFGIIHRGLPVVGVSWFEARAYSRWLKAHWAKLEEAKANRGISPRVIRLPLEWEWQRIAEELPHMTPKGLRSLGANTGRVVSCTTPIGMIEQRRYDESVVTDWIGNAWEWQANCYDRSRRTIALRGSAFTTAIEDVRIDLCGNCQPSARESDIGFRILVEC